MSPLCTLGYLATDALAKRQENTAEAYCVHLSSQISYFVWPWANYLASFSLNFLICKMGLKIIAIL